MISAPGHWTRYKMFRDTQAYEVVCLCWHRHDKDDVGDDRDVASDYDDNADDNTGELVS